MSDLRGSGSTRVRGRVVHSENSNFDKTAILPSGNKFIKLFALEGSQAKFEHDIRLEKGKKFATIPREFMDVCEEGSVHVKCWSMDEPGVCGNTVSERWVKSERLPDCGIWLTIVGVRKGKTEVLPKATKEEFENNARFYRAATTGELFKICQCQHQD